MHDHPRDRKSSQTASPAESKLAEVITYSRLCAEAAKRTASLLTASPASELLDEVREETERIKGRTIQLADSLENREQIRELSYEAFEEGTATLNNFLRPGFSPIEGLDYLAMGQAEAIGHWVMLQHLDSSPEYSEVAEWALPKLRQHLRKVAGAAAGFERRKGQRPNLK